MDNLPHSKEYEPKLARTLDRIIAFCGLICTECRAFLATRSGDKNERAKIARLWSKHFRRKFEAEDVLCDGCPRTDGRRSGYCRDVCDIRPCAQGRGLKSCAYCESYECEKLQKFFRMAPKAKLVLDKIRKSSD